MRHHLPIMALAFAAAAACSGSHRATTPVADQQASYTNSPTAPEAQVVAASKDDCPFDLAGAEITTEPIDGGMALVFTTDAEHVGEVRARVHDFAGAGGAAATDRATAPLAAGVHGPQIGTIAVEATVADTADGARLELRPLDPAQLGELRRQARSRIVAMETGACPTTGLRDRG